MSWTPDLRRLAILKHTVGDSGPRLSRRPVDSEWNYNGYVKAFAPGGFNPFRRTVYIAQHSRIAAWLDAPSADPRELNFGDFLAKEALALSHDYLHIWATDLIREINPSLGFCTAPITRENAESFAFCYLFTEAAAVVGLDYWLLCQQNIAEIWQMGTNWSRLTVSFNRGHYKDLMRLGESFTPFRPSFLYELTQFYCDGDFRGLDEQSYFRSETIRKWLSHELNYGGSQRMLVRRWLECLAGRSLGYTSLTERSLVSCTEDWMHEVVTTACERLWQMIVSSEFPEVEEIDSGKAWERPEDSAVDWRFCNLNLDDAPIDEYAQHDWTDEQWDFLIGQFVYAHRFDSFPLELSAALSALIANRNLQGIMELFEYAEVVPCRKIDSSADNPQDIFLHP